MPNVSMTFPEIDQAVSRPIIYGIVDQVEEITKIDKNTVINFVGDIGKAQQPGTSIDSNPTNINNRDPYFENNNYLFIEVTQDFDIGALTTMSTTGAGNPRIFGDDALGVYLAPMYATVAVSINFKYRTQSKTEALRWRDDMRVRVSQMRDINIHDFSYHYALPGPFVRVLQAIHSARESKFGYGDTFAEYVLSNSNNRLTLIGDLANKEAKLAIAETQARIVGMFDFDGMPEKPEIDNSSGTWTINFAYKFNYERPIACNAKYPIMVHNQLLPPELIEFTDQSKNLENARLIFSNSMKGLRFFESEQQLSQRINVHPEITIPSYDDYILPMRYPGTGTVMTVLCEVDETDKRTMVNLEELGDFAIDRDILEFIRESEYPYITNPYFSIINLSVYRNNELTHKDTVTVTPDLNVVFKQDADLRKAYRFRLALVTDLSMLNIEAVKRLKKFPKAFVKLVSAIDDLLRDHPGVIALGDKRQLTTSDLNPIFRFLTGFNLNGTTNSDYPALSTGTRVSVSTVPNVKSTNGKPYHVLDPLRDLQGPQLERYRRERIQFNKVMATSIVVELEK